MPPRPGPSYAWLYNIPGQPPDLTRPPRGCKFAARCRYAQDICRETEPTLTGGGRHHYRCYFPLDVAVETAAGETAAGATAAGKTVAGATVAGKTASVETVAEPTARATDRAPAPSGLAVATGTRWSGSTTW